MASDGATARRAPGKGAAITRAKDSKRPLAQFVADFKFQRELTSRLDAIRTQPFTQEIIKDIVLWKVNRYVSLGAQTLNALNNTGEVGAGAHRTARDAIIGLLSEPGVDLPMASAFLRFRNPRAFQIIDRHAYRALYGVNYPIHWSSSDSRKVDIYFRYLDDLWVLATSSGVDFESLDRVLYVFDKQLNGKL
jgi:hypothetical protein